MSYKVGLILSMVFVSLCFLFGADLISIQSIYSTLDAKATAISYLVSQTGAVDLSFKRKIIQEYDVAFVCPTIPSTYFGEEITFSLFTTYQPLVINSKKMKISVTRIAVVGFYG